MTHHTDSFIAATGQRIFTQHWLPEGEVAAVIVIAHGLSEHSDRYLPFIEYFLAQNYAVYALDHEGHGRSEGNRGYIGRFDDFVEALHDYIGTASANHSDKKVFLVGHSMGGAISANYLLKYQDTLSGCLLSGAALAVGKVISPTQQGVLKVLSKLAPKWGLIKLEGEAVSRDPAVVEAYETDPLVFRGKGTARLFAEIVAGANNAMANAAKVKVPMLIMHGSDDLLADVKGSEEFYKLISSKDKTLKIYDKLYHEIFLEKERLEVYADVEAWLAEHV